MWFIDFKNLEKIPEKITFNMILNLASVCNAESKEVLWGFIYNYYPELKQTQNKLLDKLLEYGVQYYNQFILPEKNIDLLRGKKRMDLNRL